MAKASHSRKALAFALAASQAGKVLHYFGAHEINMEFIYMKQPLKMPAYEEIVKKRGCPTLLSRISAMIFRIFP